MDIYRKKSADNVIFPNHHYLAWGLLKSFSLLLWAWMTGTHLDNLCQLDFGISGLCCGAHTVKQSDLLASQCTLDAPQCSGYLLSGHFLLLLSYTASVSSSGGLLLSHVAHPLAKYHSFTLKKLFLLKRQEKSSFYRLDSRMCSSEVSPHLYPQVFFLQTEKINHVTLARKGILKKIQSYVVKDPNKMCTSR